MVPPISHIEFFNRWIFHVFFTIQRATGVLPWLWKPPSINPLTSEKLLGMNIHSTPQVDVAVKGKVFTRVSTCFDHPIPSPNLCGCCCFFVLVFAIFIQCSDEVSGQVVKPMNKKETRHCWNRHLMDTMLIFILINGILQYYCISMMDQGRSWFLPPWCGLSWPFQIYVNVYRRVPSGKRLHNYGKIHHFVAGKINYFYGHFQ